jgi:hypothetical protein
MNIFIITLTGKRISLLVSPKETIQSIKKKIKKKKGY